MKSTPHAQSATSLPRAPRDDASARSMRYLALMGIRIACFILMAAITPYGWYTWVFGAGAIFIPYFAVVIANAGSDVRATTAENPERALPAPPPPQPIPESDAPQVILLHETPHVAPPRAPDEPA